MTDWWHDTLTSSPSLKAAYFTNQEGLNHIVSNTVITGKCFFKAISLLNHAQFSEEKKILEEEQIEGGVTFSFKTNCKEIHLFAHTF